MTAPDPTGDPSFATTRWTVVLAAAGADSVPVRAALETLCATYWYPLYAFARRRGADRHRAADLVQGFFAALIEKRWAADADPERGRFRAFLLTAFQRFCAKEHERDAAQKRGGGHVVLSLDFDDGETRFQAEGAVELEPERAFERRWALTILARALDATCRECRDGGRAELCTALIPYIGGAGEARPYAEIAARLGMTEGAIKVAVHRPRPYAEIAARLGMTEGAIKVAVHRLRGRYREHLRAEIRDTVSDDAAVDDEIVHLMRAV